MHAEIKKTLICADVQSYVIDQNKVRAYIPKAGDVAIFEVLSIGKHAQVQIVGGRNSHIFPGDQIMAAFGNRYATHQYEGYVPTDCLPEFHILGQGGVVGIVKSAHLAMSKPTAIRMLGYAVNGQGEVINTKYYRRRMEYFSSTVPYSAKILLSVGASMDSGKTTTAGYVARSLKSIGQTVAYMKLTGTAYTKDKDFCKDCGADLVRDFSDLGFPSTYLCETEELLHLFQTLLNTAAAIHPDYIVVELADGLYQRETNQLLNNKQFMSMIHAVLFSCNDSLSALNGVHYLRSIGAKPVAISGRYTMSPLLIEEVRSLTDVKAVTLQEILSPEFAHYIETCGGLIETLIQSDSSWGRFQRQFTSQGIMVTDR
jgi:hypothetical protein